MPTTLAPPPAAAQGPHPNPSSSDVDAPYKRPLAARPLSVDDFLAMFDHGILSPDEPVELLNGEILYRFCEDPTVEGQSVNPKPKHVLVNTLTYDLLAQAVEGVNTRVYNQGPTKLHDGSLPLPDVLVVGGTARDYAERHPTPADTLLCVEVSDTTRRKDTGLKRAAYAEAGVGTYLVTDLVHERVEAWTDPRPNGTFQTHRTFERGEDVVLSLDIVGDVVAAVESLMP